MIKIIFTHIMVMAQFFTLIFLPMHYEEILQQRGSFEIIYFSGVFVLVFVSTYINKYKLLK